MTMSAGVLARKRDWASEVAYNGGIAGDAARMIAQRFDELEARIAELEHVQTLYTLPHLRNIEKRGIDQ